MTVHFFYSVLPYGSWIVFYNETLFWIRNIIMALYLGASPFAVLGFITYNGLTAEQFIWAWIKSELLIPREIKFESNNVYWEAFIPYIANKEREELKRDKNVK